MTDQLMKHVVLVYIHVNMLQLANYGSLFSRKYGKIGFCIMMLPPLLGHEVLDIFLIFSQ